MPLLLDSHIVLWWDSDLKRLTIAQREAIRDPRNQVFISAVTGWELGIKSAAGKLRLKGPIQELALQWRFVELPITMKHSEYAAALPLHHKDPFDRMLVAQAMVEGLVLVTADGKLGQYGVAVL